MTVVIKKFVNKYAVVHINRLIRQLEPDECETVSSYVNDWSEDAEPHCYTLTIEDKLISLCILSRVSSSQFPKYDNPFIIKYIYTASEYRRQQFGSRLINYIKRRHDTFGFTHGDGLLLFTKCGYTSTNIFNEMHCVEYP
jgi:GNAT superfamily N-acetyltransferase